MVVPLYAADDTAERALALKRLSLDDLFAQEVVSVSRHREALSGAPAAVHVVTDEDIRRAGATRLPEALRLAPNLAVAQIDARQWAISARGSNSLTANKLLVLMDGRSVYTPLYSGVFWDVQDTLLEDIARIEVISGPGGTLWGSNAVNGVINVLSKPARETQGTLVSAGVGSELQRDGGVRHGGAWSPKGHYRVYGKYFERDGSRLLSGRSAEDDWNMGQGGFRVDWDQSADRRLTLQGDYYRGLAGQGAGPEARLEGGNVIGRWSQMFASDAHLTFQFYFDHTRRVLPGTFSENLDTSDFELQHRTRVGRRHHLLWGLSYRFMADEVGNSSVLAFLPARVDRDLLGGFFQDEITLRPEQLQLTFGTKVERNDYTGWEAQPSIRVAWTPKPRQTVWSAISRAVRTPSRFDRDLYLPGRPPFAIQGGAGFRSEVLTAYEIGTRRQLHSKASASLSAFRHDYHHIRSLERVEPQRAVPVRVGNGLRGESHGVELTGDFQVVDKMRVRAGYTYLNLRYWPTLGSTDRSTGTAEAQDPKHQISLRSSLDLSDWTFDAGVRRVSAVANQSLPPYTDLDARVGWQVTAELELSLVGQSLLHARHVEFGATGNRREIERSIFGKGTWRF